MTQQIVSDRAAGQRKPEPAGKTRGVWPGNPAAALWRTTVGKKIVMAVTGVILVGFVIAHMLGNLKIFLGAEDFNAYASFLRTVGEPLFPYSVLLWTARIILLVSVVLHITAAVELTRINWAARPKDYAVKRDLATTYAARTMRWGGVIVALFIVYHLLHLTVGAVGFRPGQFSPRVGLSQRGGRVLRLVCVLVLHPGDGRPLPAPGPWRLEHARDARTEQCPDQWGPPDPVAGRGAGGVRRLHRGAGCRDGRLVGLKESVMLDAKIPAGPIEKKWDQCRFDMKLVSPRQPAQVPHRGRRRGAGRRRRGGHAGRAGLPCPLLLVPR